MHGVAGTAVVEEVSSGKVVGAWNLKLAAQRLASPGSTLKPFVVMELLESGRLDPQQKIACRRPLYVAGRRLDCSHPVEVGTLNAEEAIAYSCNAYVIAAAERMNPAELEQALRRAGLASATGLSPEEVLGRIKLAPDSTHLQLQAIGEWGIQVTPLELLAAYRGLALKKMEGASFNYSPVFKGLEGSVAYGMAHEAMPDRSAAAGKTGTASDPGRSYTHGFFAGYAPVEKPEIAVVVFLEQGRGADAASIGGQIFNSWVQSRKNGQK